MQNIFKMEEIMHNQLTESDIKKMQEEIEYRKLVVRKEALEDVKEARAQGDLSENFEYYAAKKFKNKNEGRIRFLERMIKTAEVVSDESAADEVGMNNKVEVWFEEDDETETYKIVTTMRQDSLKGLISGESPLGKALLGHTHPSDPGLCGLRPTRRIFSHNRLPDGFLQSRLRLSP